MSADSTHQKRYCGVVVPMISPFTPTGDLDEPAVRKVIDHLIAGGVSGIFVLGTTGEETSMPPRMRAHLVALAVEHIAGRVTSYAGIGANCLATSVEEAIAYRELGVDVLVARLPTYYALTDDEQHAYFTALLRQIAGPLMLYNITSTTHMTISIPVVEALSEHPIVVGIKDSDGDIARHEELVRLLGDRPEFSIFVGSSALSAQGLLLGADGCVPGPGNLAPELCRSLYESAVVGDVVAAEAYQRDLQAVSASFNDGRTLAQSLGALKAAMGALGLCSPHTLPPLPTPGIAEQEAIRRRFLDWRTQQSKVD